MKGSRIVVGSPVDYEELVAYIWINGNRICIINQEDGKENLKIEFYEAATSAIIDFNLFAKALQQAKEILQAEQYFPDEADTSLK